MNCSKCGKELENGVTVCPDCGEKVVAEEATAAKPEKSDDVIEMSDIIGKGKDAFKAATKNIKKATEKATEVASENAKELNNKLPKNVKMIALGVVALILIILLGSCIAGSGSRYTTAEINAKSYFVEADDDKLVNLDGTELEVEEEIRNITYSADMSLTVVQDYERTLFVADAKGLVEVAEEVSYYVVSNYGDTIAYVTDVDDNEGTLYLYTVSKKSSVEISDEAYPNYVVLSPNGKTVAYLTDIDTSSWSVKGDLFISKNGKKGEKAYADAFPLAITDNGKNVYYVKNAEKLCMNDVKLSSKFGSSFYFSEDYKELAFNDDGDAHYYTVKMKEPVKVRKDVVYSVCTPENTIRGEKNLGNYSVYTYGVDGFNETIWNIGGSAYYVYKKGAENEKVSGGMYQYKMSENGKSMLFLDMSNDICYIKNINKSREAEKKTDGIDVQMFVASDDLKKVYFYDYDEDELCYLKKGEGVVISDDVEYDDFVYSDKYGVLYYVEDDELFYATTSSKSKKSIMNENVTDVDVEYGITVVRTYDDGEATYYIVTGKNKLEELYVEE